jgi:hypothetical protein
MKPQVVPIDMDRRCPYCGNLWEDCTAYMWEENPEAGHCERGNPKNAEAERVRIARRFARQYR